MKDQRLQEEIIVEYRTIKNGVKMPVLGFGVFQVSDPKVCEESVLTAIRHGYRLIDTAAVYGNETAVGAAIRKCGVPREELFITTKLWVQDVGYEKTKAAFAASLDRLGLDYLDLYLIHRPFGDYYGAWRAMEELYEQGKIRAIGVSNFGSDRLVDLVMNNKVRPAVNQIECHPFFQQESAREICREYGIQMEAWAPFAEGKQGIFQNETLMRIGAKYGKSPAQVILRWNIDRGVVVIPKSVHEERIAQNIDVFDFRLSKEDMDAIAALDGGQTFFVRNEDPQYVKMINSVKIH